MNDFDLFVKQFTNVKISGVVKIKRKYFLPGDGIQEIASKIDREPYAVGIFLGEKKKDFKPSPALLDIIAKISDKKIFISEKAEWLFLCGRDIFGDSIIKSNIVSGPVLVQNQKDENLGYGLLSGKRGHLSIKNILDKGDYLRSEAR